MNKPITKSNRSAARRLTVLSLALGLAALAPAPAGTNAAPPHRRRVVVRPRVRVRVRVAPPVPRVVIRPAAPSARHVWVEGYWRWDATLNRHVWVEGLWQLPPAGRVTWHPGHWDKDGDEWEWEEGHWE
jgi:hypothetical protein